MVQAAPGHKRAPSDVSVASSEDDKVPPTPSTLKSVSEKTEAEPAEDRISDKLSDEGLGTSEVDKTEEEKLNEVSDASNEGLASGLMETSKDFISGDFTESKPEGSQAENAPAESVVSEPVEPVDTGESQELVTGHTEKEKQEIQEKEMGDEVTQVIEEEKEPEEVKQDEEVCAEESIKSQEKEEDTPVTTEPPSKESPQLEEESKEPDEEMSQHKVTEDRSEDMANGIVENIDAEKLESTVMDTNGDTDTKSSVDESSAEVLLENMTIESPSEEKPKDEASEEPEQPQQENRSIEEVELQEQTPAESNGVSDEVKDTSEVLEQMAASNDVPVKEDQEKAAHTDENISQDTISVQESETDSETKTEHGSPAVIKSDVEKDSDSGSSSAADSNSLDLNLSISSFLSKSKEGGSMSVQVNQSVPRLHLLLLNKGHDCHTPGL